MDQSHYRATVKDRIECSHYRTIIQGVYVEFVNPCMKTLPTNIRGAPPDEQLASPMLTSRDQPRSLIGQTGCPRLWISVIFGCGFIFGCFVGYVFIVNPPIEILWGMSKSNISGMHHSWDYNKPDPTAESMTSSTLAVPASTPPEDERNYYFRPLEDSETSVLFILTALTHATTTSSTKDAITSSTHVMKTSSIQHTTTSSTQPTTSSFTHATTTSSTHTTTTSSTLAIPTSKCIIRY
ncbi:hypothetical protein DPMN_161112 [Dreissena polymorpha]|uniref:Uncharacterized protein n=1 Tax=Dreissena polymorpha TaxID=45954 RepID=A0A9D4ESI6_DREPO|nr:hypothetical protein DPMN_161112 [Dreissena polymorpha]